MSCKAMPHFAHVTLCRRVKDGDESNAFIPVFSCGANPWGIVAALMRSPQRRSASASFRRMVIMVFLCFSISESMRGNQSAVMWASVTYFLMGSIAYTFVNIPYGSLAAALIQNANERSKLTTTASSSNSIGIENGRQAMLRHQESATHEVKNLNRLWRFRANPQGLGLSEK